MIINSQDLFLCMVWNYSNYSHKPCWGVVTAAVESLPVSVIFHAPVLALVLLKLLEIHLLDKSSTCGLECQSGKWFKAEPNLITALLYHDQNATI